MGQNVENCGLKVGFTRRDVTASKPPRSKPAEAAGGKAKTGSEKSSERSMNVYENKGSLGKTGERSQNVYENKGS